MFLLVDQDRPDLLGQGVFVRARTGRPARDNFGSSRSRCSGRTGASSAFSDVLTGLGVTVGMPPR